MSGASGAPLTIELLKQLREHHPMIETHLIITRGAELTLLSETSLHPEDLKGMCSIYHKNDSLGAAIASGSVKTLGMIIIPCSMKTAAGIACGYSDNLLLRAADVTLKERRKLVLVAREAPLSTLHLKNLYELSQLGAIVLPPVLTYYNHPETIADCTKTTIQRVLRQFDLDVDSVEWEGM